MKIKGDIKVKTTQSYRKLFRSFQFLLIFSIFSITSAVAQNCWEQVPQILSQIQAPNFPDRQFTITTFGAVGDGKTDCSAAIRKAIEACYTAGGGRVIVPPGDFLTGAIHLKSNVNLHLSEGATLLFSQDPKDYLPVVHTRWEGVECMNYSPFLYAFEQQNIAVTGKGTLNGQADAEHWWPWKGRRTPLKTSQNAARKKMFEMAEKNVPVAQRIFGKGSYLRPNFVQPYRCKNVLIEGVTIVNSPMWEINPELCENVIVRGVRISSHGPNNDGCDPESCKNVLIEKCYFDTGDDCIALKSGRNTDGRRVNVPIENVIIRDCQMKDGHGGVVIGSEISGGARNIFTENCNMDSPNLERALRIKTNSVRGGVIENVFMRNVKIGQVKEAVLKVNFLYEEGDAGRFPPVVRNVHLENVSSKKSRYAFYLKGYQRSPIKDIFIKDCSFWGVERSDVVENVEKIVLENTTISGKGKN